MTKTVYIGTTKDSIEERWAQYQMAMDLPIKAPLYKDMRDLGLDCFTVEEYAIAESREELAELYEEAMIQYDGTSLKGVKTTIGKSTLGASANLKAKSSAKGKPAEQVPPVRKESAITSPMSQNSFGSHNISRITTKSKSIGTESATVTTKVVKPKLASGRTGSAAREKNIKEAINQEKQQREMLKSEQIAQQADEMKAIMARLDSRGSTLKKRY